MEFPRVLNLLKVRTKFLNLQAYLANIKYAIVDIETTGGFPEQHGMTEIAIVLYNGKEVEEVFESLVNPHQPIPPFIANMTGITNSMVATAPDFKELAPKIHQLLKNRVFVAHNVNFDFSFVKHHLKTAGFQLQVPKLCTIRLSRKVFPGFPKYGLGHLCRELNISIQNRHRAGGDALATAEVLDLVIKNNGGLLIKEMLKKETQSQLAPPNLPQGVIKGLPETTGVYYFHDQKGKIIYVGKAKNIRKRVTSHFTGLDISKKRQDFLRCIYQITYAECPTEFIAALMESVEIKRCWPIYNKSQKRYEQVWGIYHFEDRSGYQRLAIDKKQAHSNPIAKFTLLVDAHRTLWKLVHSFSLDPVRCFLDNASEPQPIAPEHYNLQVEAALEWLSLQNETFLIQEKDAIVLVEEGKFYGMGAYQATRTPYELEHIKLSITAFPENEVIRSMIRNYKEKFPAKVIKIA